MNELTESAVFKTIQIGYCKNFILELKSLYKKIISQSDFMERFIKYNFIKIILLIVIIGCSKDSQTNVSEPISENKNSPPKITSTPVTTADHNREYNYVVTVSDPDNDEIDISITAPAWLKFNKDTQIISGTASWGNIGNFDVTITASDGKESSEQNFTIIVTVGEIICSSDFGDPANSLYILPFQIGKIYKNIQSYCPPNPAWGHHNWFAYDFDMSIGDTIIAMRSGTVIAVEGQYTDANRQSGRENYIFILHKDGTVASYYHLTKNGTLVTVGQTISQGEIIGLSGDTGASIGPHLHVVVFRGRTNYSRQYSIPINFRNADGPFDSNNGLVYQGNYKALSFTPNGN